MLSFQTSIFIQASVEDTFNTLIDFQQLPKIQSQIEEVQILTPGPTSQGTKYIETRMIFGKKGSETMEVTGFQPHSLLTTQANSHGTQYIVHRKCAPKDDGTELTYIFEAYPQSFFAKLMSFTARFLQKHMIKMVDQDLSELKQHLEGK